MVAAAVIGGLATAGSAAYSANQAKKGANAQVEAGDRASALEQQSADKQLALQREIWEKQQADYKPYLEQGTWGINRLGDLMRNQSAMPQKPAQTGDVPIDNNPVENSIRPIAVGKKNWLFAGSERAGQRAAASHGLLATAKLNGFTSAPAKAQTKPKTQAQATQYQNNANGGFLNNPFDSYLASKGLAGGKFDTSNPAYQFQLKQGQQALDRSSAARGMGASGAQMKAAQEYGQGLASQQYDKEYNRASGEFGDYFNRLAGLAKGGEQAATALGNYGNQYATAGSNTLGNLSGAQTGILGQQANARASGYAARANAVTGGLNSLTNLYGMSQFGSGNKNSLGAWFNSDM